MQLAHWLEDELAPRWVRNMWQAAELLGGAWSRQVQRILADAFGSTLPVIFQAHPLLVASEQSVAQLLAAMPPKMHTCALQSKLSASSPGNAPALHIHLPTAHSFTAGPQWPNVCQQYCATVSHIVAALPVTGMKAVHFDIMELVGTHVAEGRCNRVSVLQATGELVRAIRAKHNSFDVHLRCADLPGSHVDLAGSAEPTQQMLNTAAYQGSAALLMRTCAPDLVGLHLTIHSNSGFGSSVVNNITKFSKLQHVMLKLDFHHLLHARDALLQAPALKHAALHVRCASIVQLCAMGAVLAELSSLRELHIECGQLAPGNSAVCDISQLAQLTCVAFDAGSSMPTTPAPVAAAIAVLTGLRKLCLPEMFGNSTLRCLQLLTALQHLEIPHTAPKRRSAAFSPPQPGFTVPGLNRRACMQGIPRNDAHSFLAEALPTMTQLTALCALGVCNDYPTEQRSALARASRVAFSQYLSCLPQLQHLKLLKLSVEECLTMPAQLPRTLCQMTSLHELWLKLPNEAWHIVMEYCTGHTPSHDEDIVHAVSKLHQLCRLHVFCTKRYHTRSKLLAMGERMPKLELVVEEYST